MNSAAKVILKIFIGIVSLIALCTIVFVIMFMTSDPNDFKQTIAERIKESTGAELQLNGNLSISALPPGVSMENVTLMLPSDKGTNTSAHAQSLRMDLDFLSLFTTEYKLKHFSAQKLSLTMQEKGKKTHSFFASKASGALSRTCCGLKLSTLELVQGNTVLSGDINIQTDLKKPVVTGQLHLSGGAPSDFMQQIDSSSPPSPKLIPKTPLPFELFEQVNFDVHVKLSKVEWQPKSRLDGHFKLVSKEGKADFFPLSLDIAGGKLEGHVMIHRTHHEKGLLEVNLDLKQGSLQTLVGDPSEVSGGHFDLHLDGQGHGKDLQEILSSWSGQALWNLKDAQIKQGIAGEDFTAAFVNFLNPFHKKEQHTKIECAVVRLDIKKGTAFALKHIGVETGRFDILGSGQVDLGTEAVDIDFNLRSKSGIDLKIGNFDKYIRVGGSLKEPKVLLKPKGVLEDGLSILSAVTTGGLSLVAEQIFDKMGDNEAPCVFVMKGK